MRLLSLFESNTKTDYTFFYRHPANFVAPETLLNPKNGKFVQGMIGLFLSPHGTAVERLQSDLEFSYKEVVGKSLPLSVKQKVHELTDLFFFLHASIIPQSKQYAADYVEDKIDDWCADVRNLVLTIDQEISISLLSSRFYVQFWGDMRPGFLPSAVTEITKDIEDVFSNHHCIVTTPTCQIFRIPVHSGSENISELFPSHSHSPHVAGSLIIKQIGTGANVFLLDFAKKHSYAISHIWQKSANGVSEFPIPSAPENLLLAFTVANPTVCEALAKAYKLEFGQRMPLLLPLEYSDEIFLSAIEAFSKSATTVLHKMLQSPHPYGGPYSPKALTYMQQQVSSETIKKIPVFSSLQTFKQACLTFQGTNTLSISAINERERCIAKVFFDRTNSLLNLNLKHLFNPFTSISSDVRKIREELLRIFVSGFGK